MAESQTDETRPPLEPSQTTDVTTQRRIRNRLIEYMEIASSFAEQQRYAVRLPSVNVAYEVINQWQDWVPSGTFDEDTSTGVYSDAEVAALVTFGEVWNQTADSIPDDYPSIEEVRGLAPWQELRSQAELTLSVMLVRGHHPE